MGLSKTIGADGWTVELDPNNGPAYLQTDANGNTVLVGAGGATISYVGNTLTVGAGGRFSNLADALTERAAVGHTLLASGTGTISYVAGEDNREILLTAAIPNETSGHLGVRLNGTGPILRCALVGATSTTTRVRLRYPVDKTYSAVQVDIYKLNPVGICILPGSRLELGNDELLIPAFTSIYCPVHRGASITHVATASGTCFSSNGEENEIWFQNLVLDSACGDLNSLMFNWASTSVLADIGYIDNYMATQSQDLVYFGGGLRGGAHFLRNEIYGTFDAVCSPALFRNMNVQSNVINMCSRGDCETGSGDQGQPTGIPLGDDAYVTGGGDYPMIAASIRNNRINCYGTPGGSGEGVRAVCVEIRKKLPSQAIVDVDGNYLAADRHGGTVVDTAKGIAAAVAVHPIVSDTSTPTIIVRNNTIKSKLTNSANGNAYSLHSPLAAYSIKTNGNRVIAGTLGSNTDATGFV